MNASFNEGMKQCVVGYECPTGSMRMERGDCMCNAGSFLDHNKTMNDNGTVDEVIFCT